VLAAIGAVTHEGSAPPGGDEAEEQDRDTPERVAARTDGGASPSGVGTRSDGSA
jgi:hypothetical protein